MRLVRGEIDGTPDPDDPGRLARRAGRRARRSPRGASGRRAAARSSPGSRVGSRRGRARARPLRRARAARRRCSPVRSSPSRSNAGARTGARGERPPARGRERARRPRRRPRAARRADRLRSRARRCAVLRASASWRPGPICAGAPSPCPSSSSSCSAPRRRASARAARSLYSVCTVNARRERGGRRRVGARDRRRASAAQWPRFRHPRATRVPADAAARPRDERLLHRPRSVACADRATVAAVGSRHGLERLDPGRHRGRAVALRRRLHALGEQIDALLGAGCRSLPFRRRRRALRPARDDRAGRAPLDRARRSTRPAACSTAT